MFNGVFLKLFGLPISGIKKRYLIFAFGALTEKKEIDIIKYIFLSPRSKRKGERMEKVIGVTPLYDGEKESLWMLPGYVKMLEAAGAVPIIMPLTTNEGELDYFLKICGGFLLTGGHDVAPSVYGAEKSPLCGETNAERDRMDSYILKKAVAENKSVLGICRGIQLMNAAFGGTLYQDLPAEYGTRVNHHMSPPYSRAVHKVSIAERSLLKDVLGEEEIGVNSYHHQAVKTLSEAFDIAAVSEDGLIEGIFMPEKKFVLGVQWHPEFSYLSDVNSRKIVKAFVESV